MAGRQYDKQGQKQGAARQKREPECTDEWWARVGPRSSVGVLWLGDFLLFDCPVLAVLVLDSWTHGGQCLYKPTRLCREVR